ncbi:MAG: choice-of-anchor D domain-containing protein, partial [Halobaculum sp.]
NVTNVTVVGNDTDAFTLSGPLVGGTPYNLTADESVDVTVNATTSVDDARALDTTLRIESEDPTSPITTIQTTANATGPVAGVNTDRLRYFSRSVDTTTNQTLLLDNRGNEPLTVEDISVSGQDASAFTVETVPRTVSGAQRVSPQDTGEITVSFTPGSGGDKRAKLTVETNDPDDGKINVTLTGAGKQPDAVTTPADTLRYGRVGTETTLTRNVTVENDGGAPLTVERVVANGSSAFSIVAGNGTGELVPGQTRTVTVAFDPAAAGELSGNLTVVSNDPDGNETVSLTGIGNVSNVSLGSEQVTFGNTGVGSSSLGSLTLSNTGNETLVIQRATVTGGDTDAFAVVTADGIRVPPDTSQTVSVAFAPDSTGTRSATLTLETNDPDEPSVTVSLDGTGAEADIVSEPASVAFGATPTGQTVTRNVTIRNDGGVSASLTSAVFTGTSAAAFSVTDGLGAGETTLGSGDTVTVTVEFAPTAQGERTGVLQLRNASNTVVTNVSVGGVGAVPDADPNTTSVNFSDTRVAGERTAT